MWPLGSIPPPPPSECLGRRQFQRNPCLLVRVSLCLALHPSSQHRSGSLRGEWFAACRRLLWLCHERSRGNSTDWPLFLPHYLVFSRAACAQAQISWTNPVRRGGSQGQLLGGRRERACTETPRSVPTGQPTEAKVALRYQAMRSKRRCCRGRKVHVTKCPP